MHLFVPQQRAYVAFTWFKTLTKSDRLYKRGLGNNKNKVSYWGKKLVSADLIEDCGTYYRLKSYEAVWSALGVKKVKKKHGSYGFRYVKLDISNKNFIKDGLTTYHAFLSKRKRNQIATGVAAKTGIKSSLVKKTRTSRLSCQSVAKLLGYKTAMSGHKYRKTHFRVQKPVNDAVVRYVSGGDMRGVVYSFKTPCFFISLKD